MSMKVKVEDIHKISQQLGAPGSLDLEPFLQCKDHSVSRETFTLFRDRKRDLLVTVPQPSEEKLPSYYESEDYISHTDAKRNLIEKIYHQVRKHSLKKKEKLVTRVNQGTGKILDVGCGTGDFLKVCEESGWSIAGVEPNDKARELAEAKTNMKEYHENIEDLIAAESGSFDVVTLWHVLEHIPDVAELIKKIQRILKPDGVLIVAVPNFKSVDSAHYGSEWAAYDVPRHLWHFSRKSIESIFAEFDMKIMEVLPMVFDSFYVSLLSQKYKTGKQNYLEAFYQGLRSNLKARQSGEYSSLIYLIK